MSSRTPAGLSALIDYLKRSRGFDFAGYKPASLERRIHKRMMAVGAREYPDYVDYLEVHPEEFEALFNTILINVTGFFRDAGAWEFLTEHVIPMILERKPDDSSIRVWSAGCASGEEAYTLAMILAEGSRSTRPTLTRKRWRGLVRQRTTRVKSPAFHSSCSRPTSSASAIATPSARISAAT
jgi:chemotaxis methyl-accepting protein methylase